MPLNEINALRKEGRLEEALALAEREYANAPGKYEGINLFWCLNDDCKRLSSDEAEAVVQRMSALAEKFGSENEKMKRALERAKHMLTPEGEMEKTGWDIFRTLQSTDLADVMMRKNLLFKYLQLELPKPSLLHSLIMTEAIKMDKVTPEEFAFTKFAEMWGLDSFKDDDWHQRPARDKSFKMPSLVEKVIGEYIREMHTDNVTPSEAFVALLEKAVTQFPRNKHLQRYSAQIKARTGQANEAIECYKRLICESPDKFYLWDDLAQLVDDPEIKIGLLCGAVMAGTAEDFVVNVRLRLADELCNLRMYGNALNELLRYERLHQQKGWPLRRKYFNVANRLPRNIQPDDNHPLYAKYKAVADRFIYSSLASTLIVKTWEKKDNLNGKQMISWQLRSENSVFWIKPRKYHLEYTLKNGTVFDARIIGNNIVWMQPTTLTDDLPWLKNVQGTLAIVRPNTPDGKTYGQVGEVFVPPYLTYGHAQGDTVTVTAILNNDGRWNALAVK
ncbi:MAG: hypothetical protein HUK13_09095 [Muribaculaceae bacterium]|nr:hypothetical protein [Muribaculaceae bacterium]